MIPITNPRSDVVENGCYLSKNIDWTKYFVIPYSVDEDICFHVTVTRVSSIRDIERQDNKGAMLNTTKLIKSISISLQPHHLKSVVTNNRQISRELFSLLPPGTHLSQIKPTVVITCHEDEIDQPK